MNPPKKRFILFTLIIFINLLSVVCLNWDGLLREYRFWQDFDFIEVNEQGYKEYMHLKSGVVMVLLPGGEFLMGSPEDEVDRREDEFLHRVRVSPFLIAKYEVSQSVWEKVIGTHSSVRLGSSLPVEVSWDDCYGSNNSFCKQLGLHLPTEAQWEYSCRAGSSTKFSFGEKLNVKDVNFSLPIILLDSSDGKVDQTESKMDYNDRGHLVDVTSLKANSFGLHNVHGNVLEWCEDVYNEKYYLNENAKNGDLASLSGSIYRVLRGGRYNQTERFCRSAMRFFQRGDSEMSPGPEYFGQSTGGVSFGQFHGHGFRPVYNLTLSR